MTHAKPERRVGLNPAVEMRTCTPSLLERRGIHPMRDIAREWCRNNPGVASELPSWSLDVLRVTLEGVA